jgi:hypothetical protein
MGYNDLLLIPAGATNIRITEVSFRNVNFCIFFLLVFVRNYVICIIAILTYLAIKTLNATFLFNRIILLYLLTTYSKKEIFIRFLKFYFFDNFMKLYSNLLFLVQALLDSKLVSLFYFAYDESQI